MNTKLVASILLFIMLLAFFSGCVEETESAEHENQPNESMETTEQDAHLTEEDWNYFNFHYFSGKDLYTSFNSGFNIINTQISLYDPVNSSFLLEVNSSNEQVFFHLHDIAEFMSSNISVYQNNLHNYTVSSNMMNHSQKQGQLFDVYQNLSYVFDSVYIKVIAGFDPSIETMVYIDISNEMALIFMIEQLITTIIDEQVNLVVSIPDDIWAEWDDKDWSFIE